jgi:hypothetical protein
VGNRQRLQPQNPLYARLQVKPHRIFDGTAYQASEVIVRDFYRNKSCAHATTQRWAEVNVSEDAARIWHFVQPGVKGVFGKTRIVGTQGCCLPPGLSN